MKILLFGGSSRLGSAFRRVCVEDVIITPSREELDPFHGTAVASAIAAYAPDVVVNCIAYNAVDLAEGAGRSEAMRVNGELPGVLARAASAAGVRFVQVSTDYVFEGSLERGYTEQDEPRPINVYGASKLAGEYAVRDACPSAYIVRTSRLYGLPANSSKAKKSFVDLILDDAARSVSVLVNASERSAPSLVDDVARGIRELIASNASPGIYHIANDGGATWFEWALEIGQALHLGTTFRPRDPATLQRPAARPKFSVLRSTKRPPLRSWQEALGEFLQSSRLPQRSWVDVGIAGAAIECMPQFGDDAGSVYHMLPGGVVNPHGFGPNLRDIYAFTAKGKNVGRGGHYHVKLDELFFQCSGTALWILSDFRLDSSTFGATAGVVVGVDQRIDTHGYPQFLAKDGTFPRIRVPAGVYHAIFPLTDERMLSVALGSTAYDKEDYRYPTFDEVPGTRRILQAFGIAPEQTTAPTIGLGNRSLST